MRWEVSGCTAAVCSKEHAAFLCCSYLAFSSSVEVKWCNPAVVLIQQKNFRFNSYLDVIIRNANKLVAQSAGAAEYPNGISSVG